MVRSTSASSTSLCVHEADGLGVDRPGPDPPRLEHREEPCRQPVGAGADDVRAHRVRVHRPREPIGQRDGEPLGPGVIVGEPRSAIVSIAMIPPAASIPAWRHAPPKRWRCARASSITAARPHSIEPTGAPRPFDTQNITVSAGAASACTRRAERDGRVEEARAVAVQRQRVRGGRPRDVRELARPATGRPLAGMCVFSIVTSETGGK